MTSEALDFLTLTMDCLEAGMSVFDEQ